MDCPTGQQCQAGICVSEPLCGCVDAAIEPVCGELGGTRRTFQNRCQMECEEHQLVYEGSCFEGPTCKTSLECRSGHRCMPLPDDRIVGNREQCDRNPTSETCIRTCVAKRRCDTDAQCASSERCVPNGESGFCTPVCTDDNTCNHDEACVFTLLSPLMNDVGVCSTRCSDEGTCNDNLTCSTVKRVCVSCDGCNALPQTPLCHRGERFESGCDLMCTTQVFDSSLEAVESEMCNGEDDDCDGQIDEGLERRCQTNVMGCEEGVQQCEAGEWGLCTPAPLGIRERCNGIDDDCDGEIDEEPVVNPVGETGCAATVSCDECDKDWRPVCTARGVVPNECFAECQGLSVLEPAECGLRVPLTSRCSTNADCALSACEDPRSAICIGVRERVSCVSLAPTGSLFPGR